MLQVWLPSHVTGPSEQEGECEGVSKEDDYRHDPESKNTDDSISLKIIILIHS